MPNNISCLDCGSDQLSEYREKNITEYRNIKKDGTISKKHTEGRPDYNCAWGIMCKKCGSVFDYDKDKSGIVTELHRKPSCT